MLVCADVDSCNIVMGRKGGRAYLSTGDVEDAEWTDFKTGSVIKTVSMAFFLTVYVALASSSSRSAIASCSSTFSAGGSSSESAGQFSL